MKTLALENYRRRVGWDALTAAEKKILAPLEDELASAEEEEGEDALELVDVVDGPRKIYLLVLWPFGSGALVDSKKKQVVADVVQHHFDARGDGALRKALAEAWERQRVALGIRETITFAPSPDEDKKRPKKTKKKSPPLERIEAMRVALRAGASADQKELWELVGEALDFKTRRPLPARRLFELDETTRAALELIHEGYDAPISNLGSVGLPMSAGKAWRTDPSRDPGGLARFLGHAPLGPLDVPVTFAGAEHPAWCLVSDAVHDLRPDAEVLDALATLSPESATSLFRALTAPLADPLLSGVYLRQPKGVQSGSPAARGAHAQRTMRFVVGFAERIGDDAVRIADEILAARADWVDRWLPQLTKSPQMGVPHWEELCVALGVLARAARNAGGVLDPGHDRLLAALARYHDATYPLAVVLADLPAERAATLARADLGLMERFPAAESTPAAIERLEASGGPYMEALFERVIAAIGPRAVPALEAAVARGSPQKKALARCLSSFGKPKKEKQNR